MRHDAPVSRPTAAVPRPVRLLAAGGTIAMRGERAVPALDATELVEQLPQVAGFHLEAETVLSVPSTHLTLADALDLARRACAAATGGEGVVLTTGTDTMEEVAALCGLMYGGDAPIVITGANRPGSAPGADGPANLLDAIVLARAPAAAGPRRRGGVRRRGPRRDDRPQDRQHRPGGVRLADRRPGRADRRGPRVAARDPAAADADGRPSASTTASPP